MQKPRFTYWILYGFLFLLSLIPFWLYYRLSDFLFFVIYHVIKYRKKVVFNNLRNAFPEKKEEELTIIAKKFYRHLCDFFIEEFKMISLSAKGVLNRFNLENPEVFQNLYEKGKDVALVSGHYGNWEWFASTYTRVAHQILIIYRPLKNKFADWLVYKNRTQYGSALIPYKQIYKEYLKAKKSGEPKGIWFLGDQRPPYNNAFWTMFLNQETSVFTGLEKLSRKHDMAVVFMDIQKVKRGYYNVKFTLLAENSNDVPGNELTKLHVKFLEKCIQERPEFWLWSHKRWKYKKPAEFQIT